jgi:hypothetical protein
MRQAPPIEPKSSKSFLEKAKFFYENNKIVAVTTVLVTLVGTLAAGRKSIQELSAAIFPAEQAWLSVLSSHPLVPGESIAGIRLDDTDAEAIKILGVPTHGPEQQVGYRGWGGMDITNYADAKSQKNSVIEYLTFYENRHTRLLLISDRDTRKVKSIGFYCIQTLARIYRATKACR